MNTREQSPMAHTQKLARGIHPLARLAGIGVLLSLLAGLFLFAGGWLTPHNLTPASMVDTFERVNGAHPGFRRNHAKGVCVAGFFESNGQGQSICRSEVFRSGRVPIVGRFALAGGNPYAADTPGNVRSLAIQFTLHDGEQWRTAMINIPVFPVSTPQAFAEFLVVSSPEPATGKVNSAAMGAFLAKHPETAAALKIIGSRPFSSGFSDTAYFGLNAFRFEDDKGQTTPVRWSVTPDQTTPTASTAATDKNYLFDALIQQIHAGPLRWHLMLTVGQPGDPTAEAARQWPPERRQIDTGVLTITTIESDDTSPTGKITFDPLVLPDGIAPSDDPLLSTRSAAYSVSFVRREGERKAASAVSAAEVGK
jgi:catalase